MFRRLSTGDVIAHEWTRFSFPPTWHSDVLRGLDYLRRAGVAPRAAARFMRSSSLRAIREEGDGTQPIE
jgi:hypothetical protein